jgi:hypothetical protein
MGKFVHAPIIPLPAPLSTHLDAFCGRMFLEEY